MKDIHSPGLQLDQPLCLLLIQNRPLMEQLLAFCINHAKNSPETGLEWAAAFGKVILSNMLYSAWGGGTGVKIEVVQQWGLGR